MFTIEKLENTLTQKIEYYIYFSTYISFSKQDTL